MDLFQTTLLRREQIAEDTCAFHLARPDGYDYLPGQSIQVSLPDAGIDDAKGPTRELTLASAPHDDELLIAMRMRDSGFKTALRDAAPGTALTISEADGELVLHSDPARPAVLIAGGIGVTPFRSIARDAAHRGLAHPLVLFYSNWRPEVAAFLPELRAMQDTNPNFRLVATMTEPRADGQAWDGALGMIGPELLREHLDDLTGAVYYLAGPPPMALAMLDMLDDLGVADTAIKSAEFYGY